MISENCIKHNSKALSGVDVWICRALESALILAFEMENTLVKNGTCDPVINARS